MLETNRDSSFTLRNVSLNARYRSLKIFKGLHPNRKYNKQMYELSVPSEEESVDMLYCTNSHLDTPPLGIVNNKHRALSRIKPVEEKYNYEEYFSQ